MFVHWSPAAHSVHTVAPAIEKYPEAHAICTVAFGQNQPAAHGRCAVDAAGQ